MNERLNLRERNDMEDKVSAAVIGELFAQLDHFILCPFAREGRAEEVHRLNFQTALHGQIAGNGAVDSPITSTSLSLEPGGNPPGREYFHKTNKRRFCAPRFAKYIRRETSTLMPGTFFKIWAPKVWFNSFDFSGNPLSDRLAETLNVSPSR